MSFIGDELNALVLQRPQQIRNIIMMGDSLSDRGTLNKTMLFGCIPMSLIGGLEGKSPNGRFTNGLVWSDHVSAKIASDFTIKRLQKKWHLDDTDIADAVIAHDQKVEKAIFNNYSLDDDKFVNYYGKLWLRSYCVGGLTSHNYKWSFDGGFILFFKRLIVSTLGDMCDKLLSYDKSHAIPYQQKAETLVVEWSGANDLLTVNKEPTIDEVDKAIAARMENIKKLIAAGYRNFIEVNLPNLALTPRYKAKSQAEQDNAQKCSAYFNSELQKACALMMQDHPYCSIDVFDVNTMFEKIYENPSPYFFDKDKLTVPYTESDDFQEPKNGMSSASGYMFYDDIHPSADLHSLMASYFYDKLPAKYELLEPNKKCLIKKPAVKEEHLLECFRKHYAEQLRKDQDSFFKSKKSNLDYKNADLTTILRHALKEGGNRTHNVLMQLGWIDRNGILILNEPALRRAMERVAPVPADRMLSVW